MTISATDVKNLREQTGAGMMDCKKALNECGGDFEKAVDFLRAKGLAAAAKKQSRVAAEGMISAKTYNEGKAVALVEVNCETDFVAKNDDFKDYVSKVNDVIATTNTTNTEELLTKNFNDKLTVKDSINEITLKLGEKIDIRRISHGKIEGEGTIGSYVHGGKIGAFVEVAAGKSETSSNAAFQEFAKNLAMHVAAASPTFLTADDIDENFKNREAEVYAAQLKEQGKPENMIDKIVQGKLNKLASEVCLYEQKFVMDPDKTVKTLTADLSKELGDEITITRFEKLNLGEGIEKKESNLADEVAQMTQN